MSAAQQQSREIFFEGIAHFEAARLEQARACFERCQGLTPGRPSVLGNLGITLFRLGQVREARPLLEQATAADPNFTQAWACLGLVHEANGDWVPAIDALSKSLEGSPASAALWFRLGQCLGRTGRPQRAVEAFDRAVEIDPEFADAWSMRGGALRELHRFPEAARSYEQAIAHGADRTLHTFYLASVRGGQPPVAPPRHYVEALFDDYAADFQDHLVDNLGYRGYEVLLRPLVDTGRRFRCALDLGCGTGLCAPLLRPVCERIDGVDLSARMLEQAAKLDIYRELIHAELGEFLAATERRADLVVAADVLNYVGDLAGVLASVARLLEPDGVFAFTVELSTDGEDLQLHPSLRYAHSEQSVRRLAARSGLRIDALRQAALRQEQGKAVAGLCVYLRPSASTAPSVVTA